MLLHVSLHGFTYFYMTYINQLQLHLDISSHDTLMYTDSDEWHQCVKHVSWPIQPDILSPPLLRLTSRKPLWLDLQPVDIKSRWRHNWKLARVVNYHLVCNPTIQQPGFDLPRQQWCLLNHIRMEQGHCGACRRKWRLIDTDLCPCGETQMMSHIVESCLLTKLNGGLSRQMKTLFHGWPVMVYDTHTRRMCDRRCGISQKFPCQM